MLSEFVDIRKIRQIILRNLSIRHKITDNWLDLVKPTLKRVSINSSNLSNFSTAMFSDSSLTNIVIIGNKINQEYQGEMKPYNLTRENVDYTFFNNYDTNNNKLKLSI